MRREILRSIEQRASDVIEQLKINALPVPVERVAELLGLQVTPANLGDEVSGVLVVQDGTGVIGYNKDQARVRQRFSIAHEIGHFVLHHDDRKLFIDKATTVFHRDGNSATGERRQEVQANQFAAALLMPRALVAQEVQSSNYLDDEDMIQELAETFEVSVRAMSLRLVHLGYVEREDDL